MKLRFWLISMAGAVAIIALGTAIFKQPYTFHGSLIEPPVRAADFLLSDQHGQLFQLGKQAGSVVLIYFGYTNCPDACPAALARFKQVRAGLGAEAAATRFVLITVDPRNDTPQRLTSYLESFDPTFIGLTGSPYELQTVYQRYGIYQAATTQGVDHTDRIYLVDKQGNLRLTYTADTTAAELTRDVQQLHRGN
ncbi:MAG: SCO family protein [Chloroflexi bacterium]|nr:SCO family protein [Chloroflexota bacterium]